MNKLDDYIKSAIELWWTQDEAEWAIDIIQGSIPEINAYQSNVRHYFEYLFSIKKVNTSELQEIANKLPSDFMKIFPEEVFLNDNDYKVWKQFFVEQNIEIECLIKCEDDKIRICDLDYDNHEKILYNLREEYGYVIHRNKMQVRKKQKLKFKF